MTDNVPNPMRDTIYDVLKQHPHLRKHSTETRNIKYIAAFSTINNRTIALDKASRSKQPIWVEAHVVPKDTLNSIPHDFYPVGRGRNSNLHKLPGFKDGALVRFYPQNVSQARDIVTIALKQT
jgi:hypothetical protein